MQVRANVPSYWVGETFDTWQGESWVQSDARTRPVRQTQPIVLPPSVGSTLAGTPDLQTFYLSGTTANLVFHAESASELWFPSSKVFVSDDGTIVSPLGLGTGAIYTVESDVDVPTPAQLRADDGPETLPATTQRDDLQLPHAYPRVAALARSITAHDTTTYDKIAALIGWMGRHTRYSTDIPPLPAGADSVDEFLFGNRVGFCEQISTSLAVMLRSLGIATARPWATCPAATTRSRTSTRSTRTTRTPGSRSGSRATAGRTSTRRRRCRPPRRARAPRRCATSPAHYGRVPWVPVAVVALGFGAIAAAVHLRRRRPPAWDARVTHYAERAGRRAGRPRRASETLPEYARALDAQTGTQAQTWARLARQVEASAYGGRVVTDAVQRDLLTTARRTRVRRRARGKAEAAAGS